MIQNMPKPPRTYIIWGAILLFALIALWLRLIPRFTTGHGDILSAVASDDPLYNLRQVEQIIANFPDYAWFDPMTLFPTGSPIYWGPLFPTIIAAACILTGSVTRPEIIATGLLIPPLMAAVMVVVMYFIGKNCGDWKTGLLASGFTAVVSGQYFSRSLYGYMDHHIGEVLFSALFCLFYMYAIVSEKDTKIDFCAFSTYRKMFLLAGLAGGTYLIGLFLMPTMILFAMIAAIFTLIQFIIEFYRGRTGEYLLVINAVVFTIAIAGLLLFGIKSPGIDLSTYSIGHIYAYAAMIGGTCALWILAVQLAGKQRYNYPAVILCLAGIFAAILSLVNPALFNLLIVDLFAFFGQAAVTNTVQEARPWSPDMAWMTFGYGLFLMAGGALVMIYKNIQDEHPHHIFSLVWSAVMFFSTWQHVRYEYYLAINIALLSAVCIGWVIDLSAGEYRALLERRLTHSARDTDGPDPGSQRRKKPKKKVNSSALSLCRGCNPDHNRRPRVHLPRNLGNL
jgi:oligosaccharyl transferase (archaeosortase A-associated)